MNLRATIGLGLLLSLALPAAAQTGGRATGLRRRSRAALSEGRLEEAYGLARAAAERSRGAGPWLEVAEIADRLRLDTLALSAYRTYLERAPRNAGDRAEIEGRVRVLEHHIRGGGYTVSEDGQTVAAVDQRAPSAEPAGRHGNVLVDWQGRPQVRGPSPSQLALAAWDGAAQPRDPSLISAEHVLGPSEPSGLGRALARP